MSIDWPRFCELIHQHQNYLLISHVRPDCDALGSELGMLGILEHLGKKVRICNGHPTPQSLSFIDPENRIGVLGTTHQASDFDDVDCILILDTSAWAQLGSMGDVVKASKAKKMILDHHLSEDDLGAEAFKNVKAEAAGRLVMEAASELKVPVTARIAMPLFAALATDTGWFRFGSASSYTYRMAADMIDSGARPAEIYNQLYEQDTLGRVRLRGQILARIVVEEEGALAHTYVLKEDFQSTGAQPSDTEDVVNTCLSIKGTRMAVILVEQQTGGFKISFRSRCHVDCSKLAEQFAGGGHKAAAGAFLTGELPEVQKRILDAVRTAMR